MYVQTQLHIHNPAVEAVALPDQDYNTVLAVPLPAVARLCQNRGASYKLDRAKFVYCLWEGSLEG